MTVKRLKELLDQCPDDLQVMTHGFKEHYDDIIEPMTINVKYNEENYDMFGMYESCEEDEKDSIEALILFRDGRLS